MLKIKDDINLKEFGFEKGGNGYFKYSGSNRIRICIDNRNTSLNRTVWLDDWIDSEDYYGTLDLLFDLIQAGLVEKVEGE